jgi:hypothetical protein
MHLEILGDVEEDRVGEAVETERIGGVVNLKGKN